MSGGDFGSLPTLPSVINPQQGAAKLDKGSSDINNMGQDLINSSLDQGKDIDKLNDNVRTTHQRFNMALDGLMSQVDGARGTINDAYDKMATARLVPPGIGHIISLFGNTDYDMDFQKMRINRAAQNLELANQQVKTLHEANSLAQEAAQFAREGKTTALNTGMNLQANERANQQSKISLELESEREARRQLEGMSVAQLQAAMKNPDLLTKQNPNVTPGLIQDVLTSKDTSVTALGTAKILQDTAGVTNKEQHINLVNNQIQTYFSHIGMDDFENAAGVAAKNGYFPLDLDTGKAATPQSKSVVNVPDQMFTAIRRQRAEATVAHEKTMADYRTAAIQNPIKAEELEGKYGRLVTDPQISKYASPDDLTAIKQGYAVFKAFQQSGDNSPGAVFQQKQIIDDITARTDKIITDAITNAPKEAQAGKKQFIQSGIIGDGDAATGVLVASTLNSSSPFSIDKNKQFGPPRSSFAVGDLYQPGDQLIRTQLQKLRDEANYPLKNIFAGGTMSDATRRTALGNMPKEKPSDKDLFEKVMSSDTGTQAKALTVRALQEAVLHNAILQLGVHADTPGLDAFNKLLYGNEVSDAYRTNGQIDPHKVANYLFQRDQTDPTHASKNLEVLIGKLNDPDFRANFAKFESSVFNTTEHAAYRERFFHNDIGAEVITPLVQAMKQYQYQIWQNPAMAGVNEPPGPGHPYTLHKDLFRNFGLPDSMRDILAKGAYADEVRKMTGGRWPLPAGK